MTENTHPEYSLELVDQRFSQKQVQYKSGKELEKDATRGEIFFYLATPKQDHYIVHTLRFFGPEDDQRSVEVFPMAGDSQDINLLLFDDIRERFVHISEIASFTMISGEERVIKFRIETPSKCNLGKPFFISYIAEIEEKRVAHSSASPPIYVQTKRGGTTVPPTHQGKFRADDARSGSRNSTHRSPTSVSVPFDGESSRSRQARIKSEDDAERGSKRRRSSRSDSDASQASNPQSSNQGQPSSMDNVLETLLSQLNRLENKVDRLHDMVVHHQNASDPHRRTDDMEGAAGLTKLHQDFATRHHEEVRDAMILTTFTNGSSGTN